MSFEWAIMHFGYPAVLVGTFFEGEVILILAGFAAHRGYLNLPLVIVAAFLGSLLGDQFYFFLGRRRGSVVLDRHPEWEVRIARFKGLMDRYHTLLILGFRFLYGLRTVAPFAIGLSSIPTWKFVILNAVSAAVWAVALGLLGFVFGHSMELILDEIKRYELAIMAGLVVIGIILFSVKRYGSRKKRKARNGVFLSKMVLKKCPCCGSDYPVRDDIERCPTCGGDLKLDRSAIAKGGEKFSMDEGNDSGVS